MRDFTMVTDGAAVMARAPNASISREIHVLDEIWMRCMDYFRNITMMSVITSYSDSATLQVVVEDFRSMKKILKTQTDVGGTINFRTAIS